jgi:hypothetical protein
MREDSMPYPWPEHPEPCYVCGPDPTGPSYSRAELRAMRNVGPVGGKPKTLAEAAKRKAARKAQRAARRRQRRA